MLAFHLVLVRLFEWLTLFPDWPDLLQISHLAIHAPLTGGRRLSRIRSEGPAICYGAVQAAASTLIKVAQLAPFRQLE